MLSYLFPVFFFILILSIFDFQQKNVFVKNSYFLISPNYLAIYQSLNILMCIFLSIFFLKCDQHLAGMLNVFRDNGPIGHQIADKLYVLETSAPYWRVQQDCLVMVCNKTVQSLKKRNLEINYVSTKNLIIMDINDDTNDKFKE